MKLAILPLLATAAHLQAGPPAAEEPSSWLVPSLDARLRYEFADVDGFDPSHGLTLRLRPGLKFGAWHGFSAFMEGEFTEPLIDDFHGGAAGVRPFDPQNSTIADPRNAELNQAYLQYEGFDSTLRAGRQRIIYDNAAFVGNVGWRQNEQTYDAISLVNRSVDGLTASYAWIDQVNRIFGNEAQGIASDVAADIHLLNLSYTGVENFTLGSYLYLMDFREDAAKGWDNDTFGLHARGDVAGWVLHGELAFQRKAGADNNHDALYFHGHATKSFGKQSLTFGIEHLDAGFQTPLATLHAFNGFADAFVGARTSGGHGGLTDTYLNYTQTLPWDLKWSNIGHLFGDNAVDGSLGFGLDSVLVKKFDEHLSATAKIGYFESSDRRFATTLRASVQVDCSF